MQNKNLYKLLIFIKNGLDFAEFLILSAISAICVYPIVVPISLLGYIYQKIIELIVKTTDPKCGPMLTGLNAVLAGKEPYKNPYFTIAPYCTFLSKVDRQHAINVINERLIKTNCYPEIQQRLVRRFGYYFWYPVENFKVERHVTYLNPEFPEAPITKDELKKLGSEKISKYEFDPELSPWEFIMVPNLIDENNASVKSALIIRCNHLLIDGYSFYKVCSRLADKPWKIKVGKAYTKKKTGFWESVTDILSLMKIIATGPYHLINMIYFSSDKSDFLEKALEPTDQINFTNSEKEAPEFDSSRVKKIRNKLNASTSSVIIAIVAEVTMRFIKSKCAEGFSKIPESICVNMAFPLPWHPDKLTNYWSVAKMKINMNKKDDPKYSLRCIQKEFETLQKSVSPFTFFAGSHLLGLLPINLHPPLNKLIKQTVSLSSMPAPDEIVDTFGYKWDTIRVGGTPPEGAAFMVYCLGYMGQYILEVSGVKTLFKSQKDFDLVEKYVHDVLEDLETDEDPIKNRKIGT